MYTSSTKCYYLLCLTLSASREASAALAVSGAPYLQNALLTSGCTDSFPLFCHLPCAHCGDEGDPNCLRSCNSERRGSCLTSSLHISFWVPGNEQLRSHPAQRSAIINGPYDISYPVSSRRHHIIDTVVEYTTYLKTAKRLHHADSKRGRDWSRQ